MSTTTALPPEWTYTPSDPTQPPQQPQGPTTGSPPNRGKSPCVADRAFRSFSKMTLKRKAEGGRWYWRQERGKVDDGVWSNKMPTSTSVVPVTDQSPTALEPEADPTLGVTVFSALTELSPHRWKVFKRLRTRRQKSPPSSSSSALSNPTPPPPSPRKVVTSILIAMPAPHHSQSERQPSAAMSEGTLVFEDEFPEVLFGVYEGAWAQHQPTASSSPPPLNVDAASRV